MAYSAMCKFCGQSVISDRNFETQEEADEWGTMACKCDEAYRYQERQKSIRQIETCTGNFREYCSKRGLTVRDEVCDIIIKTATMVLDDLCDSIVITVWKFKIQIKPKPKGGIRIKYTYDDCTENDI